MKKMRDIEGLKMSLLDSFIHKHSHTCTDTVIAIAMRFNRQKIQRQKRQRGHGPLKRRDKFVMGSSKKSCSKGIVESCGLPGAKIIFAMEY